MILFITTAVKTSNPSQIASRLYDGFCLAYFLTPKMRRNVPTFNGIHGVISQQIKIFIITAVRT
jgi:hypothetical protein